ncbi:hypothetical protein AB0L17_38315, partial [Streptomyces cellulosae]
FFPRPTHDKVTDLVTGTLQTTALDIDKGSVGGSLAVAGRSRRTGGPGPAGQRYRRGLRVHRHTSMSGAVVCRRNRDRRVASPGR